MLTEPIAVDDPETIRQICRFRADVWQATGKLKAGAFGAEGWRDPIDSDCQHWIIRNADQAIVAAGRLSIHATLDDVHQAEEYRRYGVELTGRIAAPDRVVVCPSMQGSGLGRRILDAQDQAAYQQGAKYAVRQASPGMTRLLRNRGWQILGPASDDPRFPEETFQVAIYSLAEHWIAPAA